MTLSQRIALLTGPDRAVDAEVAVALGLLEPEWAAECVAWGDQELHPECPAHGALPRFTADLNAAMSAVPEGWLVRLVSFAKGDEPNAASWRCTLRTWWRDENGDVQTRKVVGVAATPALALLSAAMMARGL